MRIKNVLFIFCLLNVGVASAETLISSVGLFVFPSKGQSEEQQSKDDYECFNWAKGQSKYDPINPQQAETVQAQTGPDGSRAKGALRGAARGALLGEVIDDDAGKGAAIGATAGMMRAKNKSRAQAQQAAAQTNQANAAGQAELVDGFKRAATVCLESKGYAVN